MDHFLQQLEMGISTSLHFTDDYLRYGYIYLICYYDKSESLDTFKMFKAEVENQLNKRIKEEQGGRPTAAKHVRSSCSLPVAAAAAAALIVVESGMEGMMHLVSNVGEIFPDISSKQE